MSLSFKPLTEAQANGLLDPGVYTFEVKYAENTISKKGNPMIKLGITLWDKEGREHRVYDFLLEALAYKLRHFCEATGLAEKYESGTLSAEDCLTRSGTCKIKIDESSDYPAKNVVADYIVKKFEEVKAQNAEKFNDDPIPF